MSNILTIQTILDKNTEIEKISDKDTLKKVLRRVIGVTSYKKVDRMSIVEAMKEVCREFDIK